MIEACTMEDGASLLSSIETDTSQSGNDRRFLVVGPEKSGKSSLLMDFALSVAMKEPCRCPPLGENILRPTFSEKNPRVCRSCIAVTFFVPTQSYLGFPMICEKEKSCSVTARYSANDKVRVMASKRIKILRVKSAREILEYLLTTVGLKPEKQSFGGFIIDDIDFLCSRCDASTSLIRMSQVVALLLETVQVIRRNYSLVGRQPIPAIVLSGTAENNEVRNLSKFFLPTTLFLHRQVGSSFHDSKHEDEHRQDPGLRINSTWFIEVESCHRTQESRSSSISYSIAQYCCSKKILWRLRNKT